MEKKGILVKNLEAMNLTKEWEVAEGEEVVVAFVVVAEVEAFGDVVASEDVVAVTVGVTEAVEDSEVDVAWERVVAEAWEKAVAEAWERAADVAWDVGVGADEVDRVWVMRQEKVAPKFHQWLTDRTP